MKIIIYGLGKRFHDYQRMLETTFEVVGYCDKTFHEIDKYITPKELSMKSDYDAICITSAKLYSEIRESLISDYDVPKEKIKSISELFGIIDGSEERKKWVIEQLNSVPAGKTLLDAGAGEMQFKPYCSHLNYIAQDFGKYDPKDEPGGLKGGEKWDTTQCDVISDIINIPLEDSSVDVILCTEVFEHLKNPILAVKEFSRLLKPEGLLILTAPFCSLTHMAPFFYYSGFSEYWFKDVLNDHGFEIKKIEKNSNLFMYFAWWMFRLESITRQYTGCSLNDIELSSIEKTIELLVKLGKIDTNSSETLCFGHGIIAEKRM